MNKLLFIIFLFSFTITTFSQQVAKIGMPLDSVKKMYPYAHQTVTQSGVSLEVDQTIRELTTKWVYSFEDGKLKWMMFSKYIDDLTETNFKKCLKATKEIIADYTERYGEPDEIIEGKQTFVDPYKKKHWGYDVLEARWKNVSGEKMKVEFTFMGGKGEYHLIVSIHHFDKDYPYYE